MIVVSLWGAGTAQAQLDETWTVTVNGQSVQVNPDGSFVISNIPAPDQFGPGGPGTAPDFLSDDVLRVFGVSTAGGVTRYAYSEPFQLEQDGSYSVQGITIVDEPPLQVAQRLHIEADGTQLAVGESIQLTVTAELPTGIEVDATPRSTGTVYRTSSPSIATVGEDGLVTAHGPGPFVVTAVNGGATGVKLFGVTIDSVDTTVEGFVQFADGSPISGATVEALDVESTTDESGFFSFAATALPAASISVTATANIAGGESIGASETVSVVTNGITDAGIIILEPPTETADLLFAQLLVNVGDRPRAIAADDLDRNGTADLAVANFDQGTLTLLFGAGNGNVAERRDIDSGTWPRSVVIGRMNNDGAADLVVADASTSNVLVHLNNGNGTFAPFVTYSVGRQPVSVATADFNGDTFDDVAVANDSDGTVSVLINNGDGTLADQVVYPAGSLLQMLKAADVDGVNGDDLIVADRGGPEGGVLVMLNNGDGTFAGAVRYDTGTEPVSVAVGDLDGDQLPDLAVGDLRSELVILSNAGSGTFSPPVAVDNTDAFNDVVLVDLNGDDRLDVVGSLADSFAVLVLLNGGDGTLGDTRWYLVGPGPVAIAPARLDGDGDMDLAVVNLESNNVSLMFNSGAGTFAVDATYGIVEGVPDLAPAPAGGFLLGMDAADFDGDGTTDIVRIGEYGPIVSFNGGSGSLYGLVVVAELFDIIAVSAGDVTGDGIPDVIGFSSFDDYIVIIPNNGNRTFGEARRIGLGDVNVQRGTVDDLDHDGDADIIVAATPKLFAIRNDDGVLAEPQSVDLIDDVVDIVTGDVTGEGNIDVLVVTDEGTVELFVGNGDGTIGDGIQFAGVASAASAALADVNGDGGPDLIITGTDANTVEVLLSEGGGTFAAPVSYGGGLLPVDVAVGDVTGDNLPDLLVANYFLSSVSVLTNLGEGTFSDGNHYRAGLFGHQLVLEDFDSDGDLDVAVGDFFFGGQAVTIMLNRRIPQDCDGNGRADEIDVALGAADCNQNGMPDSCEPDCDGSGTLDICELRDGLFADCNENLLPDSCEPDCNGNSAPDDCDLDGKSPPPDCNRNGIPDECDIAPICTANCDSDCNLNGVPDACERDCNRNGLADECDIDQCAGDPACDDCNGNGVPDGCELGFGASDVLYGVQGGDCCGGRLYAIDPATAAVNLVVNLDARFPNLDMCGPSGVTVSPDFQSLYISLNFEDAVLKHDLDSEQTTLVGHFSEASPSDIEFLADGVTLVVSDPRDNALYNVDPATGQDTFRCNTVYFDGVQNQGVRVSGLALRSNGVLYGSTGGRSGTTAVPAGALLIIDPTPNGNNECMLTLIGGTGFERVAGITFLPDDRLLGSTAREEELIEINPATGVGTLIGNFFGDSDICSIDGLVYVPSGSDCNENSIPDECDIDSGFSLDNDSNGIPDECEVP